MKASSDPDTNKVSARTVNHPILCMIISLTLLCVSYTNKIDLWGSTMYCANC